MTGTLRIGVVSKSEELKELVSKSDVDGRKWRQNEEL